MHKEMETESTCVLKICVATEFSIKTIQLVELISDEYKIEKFIRETESPVGYMDPFPLHTFRVL